MTAPNEKLKRLDRMAALDDEEEELPRGKVYLLGFIAGKEECVKELSEIIFAEVEKIRAKEIHRFEILRENTKDYFERKFWEGAEYGLRQLTYWLAELKKMCTEIRVEYGTAQDKLVP